MTTDATRLTVVTAAESGGVARKRLLTVLAHVVLIATSILMLYPLLWMMSASFRPQDEIFNSTPEELAAAANAALKQKK